MEDTELPNGFMSTASGRPSGTICENFILFEIVVNLFLFFIVYL